MCSTRKFTRVEFCRYKKTAKLGFAVFFSAVASGRVKRPVDQPSLGSLISVGFNYIFSGSWWITAFPGICLVVLVLVINLLGDWLRDVFNPKIYKG